MKHYLLIRKFVCVLLFAITMSSCKSHPILDNNLKDFTQVGEKIVASDGSHDNLFGVSMSVSGNYSIVGARILHENGNSSGAAYIFKRSNKTWTEMQKLIANNGDLPDGFGFSAVLSGDFAIVGDIYEQDSKGIVYIYKRNGEVWQEIQKLNANDGNAGDSFGQTIAVYGNYIFVGASADDNSTNNSGSIYVFKESNGVWSQIQKLIAPDGAEEDHFGQSLAASGGYLFVGAVGDDEKGQDSGSIYVFKLNDNNWIKTQKIIASDGQIGNAFGTSISISGDYTFVGTHPIKPIPNTVYVFKRTKEAWEEFQKITTSNGNLGDAFGLSISSSDEYVIIGAPGDNDNGEQSGSAYIFNLKDDTWSELRKITASDGKVADIFGSTVAMSNDYAIVSAVLSNSKGNLSGAIYVFNK